MNSDSGVAPPASAGTGFLFGKSDFYFVRHGETHETKNGIVQGHMESLLTETGRASAETLAEMLRAFGLGAIYSSPLQRAWVTASIISQGTQAPLHALPGLKERYWGTYQGRPKTERPGIRDPQSAESLDDFSARVMAAMRSITGPRPVLVVAHSGVFRVLLQHINLPTSQTTSIDNVHLVHFEPPSETRPQWRISDPLK